MTRLGRILICLGLAVALLGVAVALQGYNMRSDYEKPCDDPIQSYYSPDMGARCRQAETLRDAGTYVAAAGGASAIAGFFVGWRGRRRVDERDQEAERNWVEL
jgi:hypothetical protein